MEIKVHHNGRLLKVIEREPREGDDGPGVNYKGKFHLLYDGDCIDTAGSPTKQMRNMTSPSLVAAPPPGPDLRKDLPQDGDWHDAQKSVIEAEPGERLIVEAPPGTGKTAVACARIAFLLRSGIPADKIWLFSFTRTAVQEIRNRVRSLAREDEDVSAVRIATLDSTAWQLRQGFDSAGDALRAGFEQGIQATIALLNAEDSDLNDALSEIEHIVIDEAQDVMRERAELVKTLIRRLTAGCGVTILCDSAQAIYGFDEETDAAEATEADTLVTQLRRDRKSGFAVRELSEVIRTNDPALRALFVETRRQVLSHGATFAEVRESIVTRAHGRVGHDLHENGLSGRSDVLALFRQRAEVLTNGAFFANKGNPFRLRLSVFPVRLAPWLALVFGEWPHALVTRQQFAEIFAAAMSDRAPGPELTECWQLLVRHAGTTGALVDLRILRDKLSRQHPPIEFTTPELGDHGPLLSTIHASKGREADEVHLMLRNASSEEPAKEEQRVIFVGATRARKRLLVGNAVGGRSSSLQSGRRYSLKRGWRAQIEVGRQGDLDEPSVVSRRAFSFEGDARANQKWIASLGREPAACAAWRVPHGGSYVWQLQPNADRACVGHLSTSFHYELLNVRAKFNAGGPLGYPGIVPHVFAVCARTVVRPPGSDDLHNLHEPWATSGFWLAPVLFAYTTVNFSAGNTQDS